MSHCPIPNNNPYKKIIEEERKNSSKLDATTVKYYIDPALINLIGFDSTNWGFSWRNKITSTTAWKITRKHNPHANEYTYSFSFLDSKKETHAPNVFDGYITDFEDLVKKLALYKVPFCMDGKEKALSLFLESKIKSNSSKN